MDTDTIDGAGLTSGKACLRAKTALDVAPGYRLIQQHGALLEGMGGGKPNPASGLDEHQLAQLWTPWERPRDGGVDYQLAIADADSGDFRGSLVVRSAGPGKLADLGYWVDPEFWGQGLGTEAVCLALAWAFRHLEASGVTASVQPDNSRSRRLLHSLGFKDLGPIPGLAGALIAYHLPRSGCPAPNGN
ncbi:MAG: GNAT family N-acetyltransferase [bacterium]|nr:GNAT family N-acetyltransferase [bacterium]